MLCPKRVWSVYILGHDNFVLLVMPMPLGTPFRNSLESLLRTRQTIRSKGGSPSGPFSLFRRSAFAPIGGHHRHAGETKLEAWSGKG